MNLGVNARDAMSEGGRLLVSTANLEFPAAGFGVGRRIDGESSRGSPPVRGVDSGEVRVDPLGGLPAPTRPGSYVGLSVIDNGCGMDEDTRSRIFEPFFTTKKRGKGTGLGLSTVYGIVQQCDGEIHVRSRPGHGASFFIYFPRVPEWSAGTAAADARPARPIEDRSPVTGTILLVDDTRAVRTLARSVLESAGFRVLDAESAEQATQVFDLHAGEIDLLLTDVVMPRMNGWELAESLLTRRSEMKVLYMSGYAPDPTEAKRRSAVGPAFLQKPFTPDMLVSRVRHMLRKAATVSPC
jgi:CheY-like chemotaxis protein